MLSTRRPPRLLLRLGLLCVAGLAAAAPAGARDELPGRALADLADRFFGARPATRFETWAAAEREALLAEAEALGPMPEGSLEAVRDVLWKAVHAHAPRLDGSIETPYGEATYLRKGRGGARKGLLIGLHGGGEGAGSASEAAGSWTLPGHLALYPQGIRLVHDTWNTVHGEAFVLTLIEHAKAREEIDPDRVHVAGFSMGGTGTWHMAGRHPDLFAGAIAAHGVIMAAPKSQVATPEEVQRMQHGLLPNARNLTLRFYTGLEDRNCMPGTFLRAAALLDELRASDPGGWSGVHFEAHEGIAHTFPPGEPRRGLKAIAEARRDTFPETVVWEYAADPFPLPDEEDVVSRPIKRSFYWIHCERPADGMQVRAVRRGNTIDLELVLVWPEDITIHLNPSMIDVEEEVVVRVGGEEVWRGRPEPSYAVVLATLDAKLDRRMLFDRRIRLGAADEPPSTPPEEAAR